MKQLAIVVPKLLFLLAIAALTVKAITMPVAEGAKRPDGNCSCQCPYYCSGPPACICVEPPGSSPEAVMLREQELER